MLPRSVNDGASGIAMVGAGAPRCGGGTNLLAGGFFGKAAAPGDGITRFSGRGAMLATLNSALNGFLLGSFCVRTAGGATRGVTTVRRDSGRIRRSVARRGLGILEIGMASSTNTICTTTDAAPMRAQWRPSTRSGVISRKVGSAWVDN